MKCPYCASEQHKVVDKRSTDSEEAIRRRRECHDCKRRFTTYERVEAVDLFVIKKDEHEEPFSKEKVREGIMVAVEKRPVSEEQVAKIVDKVESKLLSKKNKAIRSREIGNIIMRELKKLDKVAYLRFASVYREFDNLDSFEKELKVLQK